MDITTKMNDLIMGSLWDILMDISGNFIFENGMIMGFFPWYKNGYSCGGFQKGEWGDS